MKRLLLFLSLCLSLPLAVMADDFTSGDGLYQFTTTGSNTVSVKAANTSIEGEIVIPSTVVNGGTTYTVSEIRSGGFVKCSKITSVIVPTSVEKVNSGAFANCSSLKYVEIQCSTATVDYQFLASSNNVEHVKLACDLVSNMFSGKTNLKTVELTKALTDIPDRCFYGCSTLENFTIPSSVTSIGTQAFEGCTSLTVSIPPSATIGNAAFFGCKSAIKTDVSSLSGITGFTYTLSDRTVWITPNANAEYYTAEGYPTMDAKEYNQYKNSDSEINTIQTAYYDPLCIVFVCIQNDT